MKSFAIEPVTEVQFGANQINQAFFVAEQLNTLVFETLVFGLGVGFEIHTVREPRTASAEHGNAEIGFAALFRILEQGLNLVGGFLGDLQHNSCKITRRGGNFLKFGIPWKMSLQGKKAIVSF